MNEQDVIINLQAVKIQEIIFTYMIFQTDINRNLVWYYLDGSHSRRTLRVEQLLKITQDKWPQLVHDVYEACRSTSFFLLDTTVPCVKHLFPQANDEMYPDNIQQVFNDTKVGRKTKTLIKDSTSINDILNGYGFAPLDQHGMDKFKVAIQPQTDNDQKGGFLHRFLTRRSH